MQDAFERLLRDLTLVTLALGIALGWALFQVGEGVAQFVTFLFIDYPESDFAGSIQPLTWLVRGRILAFGQLVEGLIELAVVLAVALFVHRRYRGETSDITNPS